MANTSPISIANMSGETTGPAASDAQTIHPALVSDDTGYVQSQTPATFETEGTTVQVPFVFDARYKGDALTQRVSSILGLTDTHGWSIVDTHENLALVHYDDGADMDVHGWLRGVLVDTEIGVIIAKSFGYTPTAVAKTISEVDGVISVCDTEGAVHTFSAVDTTIKRVFEGVVFRVIWHNSRAYRLTHRKIIPLRSRWGSSPSFLSMYQEAGGPTDEQLFDTTKAFSDSCYVFLVSHPSLLVGTRQNVTCPYIVCLGHYQMNTGRPAEDVAPGINNFSRSEAITGAVNEPFIHDPKTLSLQEANHHLRFGYYNSFEADDERQLTGEAIIMYRMVDGEVADIVKIHSPSYEWRVTMRGNNPNISHQFYSMLNLVYRDIKSDAAWQSFQNKFILFPIYDEQSLKQLYEQNQAILTIPTGPVTKNIYANRDTRIHILWMNYVLSLPASIQRDALDLISQFRKDRDDLIDWLQQIESTNKNIETATVPNQVNETTETTELSNRVKGLISSSRRLARARIDSGNNYSAKGSYMKLPTLIKATLRNLINKEDGPSLYKLVREMKQARKAVQVHPAA